MNRKNLKLGFSPCPNDTFIFYGLVSGVVRSSEVKFEFVIEDVEFLNKEAILGNADVTKISYYAFSQLTKDYIMLESGGALGRNCGPLLISNNPGSIPKPESKIAIPGKNTTANLLLSLAYPACTNKIEMLFSDIEEAVLSGQMDFGLIIHESRFTYADKGLHCVKDLGVYWEETTSSPIPLGGICIRRSYDLNIQKEVDRVISESVRYAFEHPEEAMDYVRKYANAMDEKVMKQHIDLYVNGFSLALGEVGRAGVDTFFTILKEKGKVGNVTSPYVIAQD